jgi:hypothetical protein
MNEKIKAALEIGSESSVTTTVNTPEDEDTPAVVTDAPLEEEVAQVVTTRIELEAFYIIKGLLRGAIDLARITFADFKSYFCVCLDGKSWKWIVRLKLSENYKTVQFKKEKNASGWEEIKSLDDLYDFEDRLFSIVKQYSDNV